jgi:hypothetical protein
MLQFTEMGVDERKALISALLRYCELDTFAMVIPFEYWREQLKAHFGNIVAA